MKKLSSLVFGLGVLGVLQGCGGDADPGVCYTTGSFPTAQVPQAYANQICVDWVQLLLANCVQLNDLSLNPSATEIGAFCGSNVHTGTQPARGLYPTYGSDRNYSYQLRHTCNFIDNPNYAVCSRYASSTGMARQPVTVPAASMRIDMAFFNSLTQQIDAKPGLRASVPSTSIYLEGVLLNLGAIRSAVDAGILHE